MTLDNKTKVLALAKLKLGSTPTEVSEELQDISYAQALKLKKQLTKAESKEQMLELFDLDEEVLNRVLEQVKANATNELSPLVSEQEIIESVSKIQNVVDTNNKLQTELEESALSLLTTLKLQATTAKSPETILVLAEAISKLQLAFFSKGNNIQINNLNGQGFEKYLRD